MAADRRKPNLLLVYTDQQRHDTIGALGARWMRTPNLDRLVAEGTAFTRATAPCPVCMPARWSLHTGQWTTTHGCYSNHHPGERPAYSLPELLREAGYRTGLAGKNHCFLKEADLDFWQPAPQASEEVWRWEQEVRRVRYPRLAEEAVPGGVEGGPERAKTNAAIRFIEEAGKQPWFLWLSYLYPHTPYEAPEPYFSFYAGAELPQPVVEEEGLAGKPFRQRFHRRNNEAILPFTGEQTRLMRRVYCGMISCIDAEIGLLLGFLKERGLADDTMILFTSDHGDYMGDHGLFTKSPALYDCLVRVPLIVRWPGIVEAGRTDTRWASGVDLLPTLCAAAGAEVPAEVQGVDLLGGEPLRDAAFSEYGVPGEPYDEARLAAEDIRPGAFANPWEEKLPWEGNPVSLAGRIRMIRTERWKLVEDGDAGELYDLEADPHELANLWERPEHADRRAELRERLAAWKAALPRAPQ
jgi:arylsulfatase A-like enzyme